VNAVDGATDENRAVVEQLEPAGVGARLHAQPQRRGRRHALEIVAGELARPGARSHRIEDRQHAATVRGVGKAAERRVEGEHTLAAPALDGAAKCVDRGHARLTMRYSSGCAPF